MLFSVLQGNLMRSTTTNMAVPNTMLRRELSSTFRTTWKTTTRNGSFHCGSTRCGNHYQQQQQEQQQGENVYSSSFPTSSWSLQRRGFASRRFTPRSIRRRRLERSTALIPKEDSRHQVPCSVRDMDDVSLSTLGSLENHVQALEEMLKRHIMHVDGVEYSTACRVFERIEQKNHEYERAMALPFQIGIVLCAGGGFLSIPLVFHLPTVEFFNEHFVTSEHPTTKELETALEVGSWSWNWMEPVLGTSTFILLCLQYMRIHLNHLGVQPFTYRMKRYRAENLIHAFPQYNKDLLTSYSQASPFYNPKELWL